MPRRVGRYAPLLNRLEALPADQSSMRLTLAELEALIGGPLPASAYMRSYWTHSDMARKNWRRLGWSAQFDRAAMAVLFSRLPR